MVNTSNTNNHLVMRSYLINFRDMVNNRWNPPERPSGRSNQNLLDDTFENSQFLSSTQIVIDYEYDMRSHCVVPLKFNLKIVEYNKTHRETE